MNNSPKRQVGIRCKCRKTISLRKEQYEMLSRETQMQEIAVSSFDLQVAIVLQILLTLLGMINAFCE